MLILNIITKLITITMWTLVAIAYGLGTIVWGIGWLIRWNPND